MAKKKKKSASKYKDKPRKSGTHYERNREAIREQQQRRRADIKAGLIIPKSGSRPRKKSGKAKPVKAVKEVAPKAAPKKKSAPKHTDQRHRTASKIIWAKKKKEEERLAFIADWNKNYNNE